MLDWPLMQNNIAREDLDAVVRFLQQDDPILTQSQQVRALRAGVVGLAGRAPQRLRQLRLLRQPDHAGGAARPPRPGGEVIVPTLTWVSDIAAVLHAGFTPVFVDIDPRTLGMDNEQVLAAAHAADPRRLPDARARLQRADRSDCSTNCTSASVPLIEDVCESHGATFEGRKLGTLRPRVELLLLLRPPPEHDRGRHGLHRRRRPLRDASACCAPTAWCASWTPTSREARATPTTYPDLNPDFIFACPAYNVRSTEINAVIGRSQLKPPRRQQRAAGARTSRLFLRPPRPRACTSPTSPPRGAATTPSR